MRNYYIRKIKTKRRNKYTHEYKDKNGKSVSKKILKPYLNIYIAPAYDNVKINKNLNVSISLSIGISIFPDDTDNKTQLLESADKAMYKAKKSGKNNYHLHARN